MITTEYQPNLLLFSTKNHNEVFYFPFSFHIIRFVWVCQLVLDNNFPSREGFPTLLSSTFPKPLKSYNLFLDPIALITSLLLLHIDSFEVFVHYGDGQLL